MTSEGAYSYNRTQVLERYAVHVQGDSQAVFLALVNSECSKQLHEAVEKAAEARGLPAGQTIWLTCSVSGSHLEPTQLLDIIEGLDPVSAVVLDGEAMQAFAQAYRIPHPAQGRATVLGRPVCLIPHAQELLATPQGKQELWSLMKTLPVFCF